MQIRRSLFQRRAISARGTVPNRKRDLLLIPFVRLAVLGVLGGALLWHNTPVAVAADPDPASAKAILVLDASGSMWGQAGGRTKIEIAREVISDILNGLDPKIQLGLMAYGHRQKGDCGDIELLIPSGPVNKAAFLGAVNGLAPKGMTPLTDAVLQAADALNYTEQRAAVILVSDGIETCKNDPCTAAKQLAAKGLDFNIHVIGFDLSSKDLVAIECLATETGGKMLAAADAGSLKAALQTVVAEVTAPAPREPAPAASTGRLQLKTLASEGGREVDGVYYTVKDAGGQTRSSGAKQFTLAPGKYTVSAQWGRATTAAVEVEIKAGETVERTLILGAGVLTVKSFASEGGEEVSGYYHVLEYDADLQGNRETVTSSGAKEFRLPAGRYILRAKWGPVAEVEKDVTIEADKTTEAVLVLNAGILNIRTLAAENGEVIDDAYHTVLSPQKNLRGERTEVTSSGAKQFILPAGSYLLGTRWGGPAAQVENAAEIKGGEATELVVVLNAGIVAITAAGPEGQEMTSAYTTIFSAQKDLKGGNKEVTSSGSRDFKLSAGSYIARVRSGNLSGESTFEIRPGERTEVKVSVK